MTNSDEPTPGPEREDHGEVVRGGRWRVSGAWIFPVLAITAAGWLFFSNWRSRGPEIEIDFDAAPGLQAGKTVLLYRGAEAGKVTKVELRPNLGGVRVTVLLQAFAEELAREKTIFWIDKPVVSLVQLSGLESIIQGNSLQARLGGGERATHFEGLSQMPIEPLEAPSVVLSLRPQTMPRIVRGAPVFHRGVAVGAVNEAKLDEAGDPLLEVVVGEEFSDLVGKNSRFWQMPLASLKTGASGVSLAVPSVAALVQGGIEFDSFGDRGEPVEDEAEFQLFATEAAARATSPPIHITFDSGLGLVAGETELRYLDVTIGIVASAELNLESGKVDVVAHLEPEFDRFRSDGAGFTLVRARVTLEGVSGLDTLLNGNYIACEPGDGTVMGETFEGRTPGTDWLTLPTSDQGLAITVAARRIGALGVGAPVMRRGVVVGRVIGKGIGENGTAELKIVIEPDSASTVRENARFWASSAITVGVGPGGLQLAVDGLDSLLQGGVEFDVFGEAAGSAADGAAYSLFETEAAARAVSPPIRISFADGQGLVAGRTQMRFRGLPVGLVESVTVEEDGVRVVARFEAGYPMLRRRGSVFTMVRPEVSLEGVTGLETLVSGVYIDCVPGTGDEPAEEFVAQSTEVAEEAAEDLQAVVESGLQVVLAAETTKIGVNAPVFYRGVTVGKVLRKALSPEAGKVDLVVEIEPRYAPLVRTNTRFWDVGGLKASLGFLFLKVEPTPLTTLTLGGIAFATPDDADLGERVGDGSRFPLYEKPKGAWLKWAPSVPVGGPVGRSVGGK